MTDKQIVGENLVATLSENNYYTRTLNKMSFPRSDMKPMYSLTLDYTFAEASFTMNLDKESLKGLADFIYGVIGEEKEWSHTRPIVGVDDNGQPITIDSWGK
jgi:hypothetical protein